MIHFEISEEVANRILVVHQFHDEHAAAHACRRAMIFIALNWFGWQYVDLPTIQVVHRPPFGAEEEWGTDDEFAPPTPEQDAE